MSIDATRQYRLRSVAPLGQTKEAHDDIKKLANDLDATPLQVALAWLFKRSKRILPIPGTSSIKHLEENIAPRGLEFLR